VLVAAGVLVAAWVLVTGGELEDVVGVVEVAKVVGTTAVVDVVVGAGAAVGVDVVESWRSTTCELEEEVVGRDTALTGAVVESIVGATVLETTTRVLSIVEVPIITAVPVTSDPSGSSKTVIFSVTRTSSTTTARFRIS
jgi:hypothetical protein